MWVRRCVYILKSEKTVYSNTLHLHAFLTRVNSFKIFSLQNVYNENHKQVIICYYPAIKVFFTSDIFE